MKNSSDSKNKINIVRRKKSIFGYQGYSCYENGYSFSFRYKKASLENSPVVIYCPSSAAAGSDNIKNLIEVFLKKSFTALNSRSFNFFVVQVPKEADCVENELEKFCKVLCDFAKAVPDFCGGNKNRIYIYGTSLGGHCVWHCLKNEENLFAAALAVEGGLLNADDKSDEEILKIAKTPLWIAHASNDKTVSIKSDDRCYMLLKKAGADVIYTRTDRLGHKMSDVFYRKEPWVQWMFSKERK